MHLRFIPACAGNRRLSRSRIRLCSVHPRVCGEQRDRWLTGCWWYGSSPRVRGTERSLAHRLLVVRFIPACAGNRCRLLAIQRARSVHPRVCGEQISILGVLSLLDGSSPRVRGTDLFGNRGKAYTRFIPACAGNRSYDSVLMRPKPVHPRVCGEQIHQQHMFRSINGSSPRVRGTAIGIAVNTGVDRFIPACAGNRKSRLEAFMVSSVHPRVCGEQLARFDSEVAPNGSSPRVRGTVPHQTGPLIKRSVHPRVCGEQCIAKSMLVSKAGSSPRVRGTVVKTRMY